MVTVQLTGRDAPSGSVPIVALVEGVAVQPGGKSSVTPTLVASGPARLAIVPVTWKVSPALAGEFASIVTPSEASSAAGMSRLKFVRYQDVPDIAVPAGTAAGVQSPSG